MCAIPARPMLCVAMAQVLHIGVKRNLVSEISRSVFGCCCFIAQSDTPCLALQVSCVAWRPQHHAVNTSKGQTWLGGWTGRNQGIVFLFVCLFGGGGCGKNFAWLHYTTCLFFSAYVSFILEISICLCCHGTLLRCGCICGSCKLGCGRVDSEMNGSRVCGSSHRTLLLDPPPCLITHQ